MGSMNWTKVKSRKQMRQQGVEDKKAERSTFNPSFKKRARGPALSKAEERALAEKAIAEWKAQGIVLPSHAHLCTDQK